MTTKITFVFLMNPLVLAVFATMLDYFFHISPKIIIIVVMVAFAVGFSGWMISSLRRDAR